MRCYLAKGVVGVVLGTIGVLISAAPAGATPLWEFTTAGGSFTNNTWDFATAFAVTTTVSASGLGYYADPNNGFVNSNPVALYLCADAACDSTGTLIASAT